MRCSHPGCRAAVYGVADLPLMSKLKLFPNWKNVGGWWLCPKHAEPH